MATFQSIIDSARVFLQDPNEVRYPSFQLLEYANEAVAEAKKIRPDFFFGSYTQSIPVYDYGDELPIPYEYHSFIKDYVIGRTELRDDEYSVDGRAALLMVRFKNGMTRL